MTIDEELENDSGIYELLDEINSVSRVIYNNYQNIKQELKDELIRNNHAEVLSDYLESLNFEKMSYDEISKRLEKVSSLISSKFSKAYLECSSSKTKKYSLTNILKNDYYSAEKFDEEIDKVLNKEEDKSPYNITCECGNKQEFAINVAGYLVCASCGLEGNPETYIIQTERRMVGIDQVKLKKQTEIVNNYYGPRVLIDNRSSKNNSKQHFSVNETNDWYRRIKLNNKFSTSLGNSLRRAVPCIQELCSYLDISSDYIKDTASKIYKKCFKNKLIRGRSIETLSAACLYASTRIFNKIILPSEIIEYYPTNKTNFNKALSMIKLRILPELGLIDKYKHISLNDVIYKLSSNLNLSNSTYKKGIEIADYLKKINFLRKNSGKKISGLGAAITYLSTLNTHEKKSQLEVEKVARVTAVTIRNRAKEIAKFFGTEYKKDFRKYNWD